VSDDEAFTHVHDAEIGAPMDDEEEGLILRWRRRGAVWEGLVSHEVDGRVITEWVPALVLPPVMPRDSETCVD